MAEHERGAHENEYHDAFVAGLEWLWGEGFLSPGGPEEVASIVRTADLTGREVLDIGCGLGAVDVLLAGEHGAARVVGIDVEAPLVERARASAARAGLADRIDIRLVEPGPLPFADGSFDVAFSKDSIIHIPDKAAFYAEVLRVLRPGGVFVGSDWLRGGHGPHGEAMRRWLDVVGLTFDMRNAERSAAELERAGFVDVAMTDRNAWYEREVEREIDAVAGDDNQRTLAERIGADAAAHRLESCTAKLAAVREGSLRPTHFFARRPL